jgi:hypothetical protein
MEESIASLQAEIVELTGVILELIEVITRES